MTSFVELLQQPAMDFFLVSRFALDLSRTSALHREAGVITPDFIKSGNFEVDIFGVWVPSNMQAQPTSAA